MKLLFVAQRYGEGIAGGAEEWCRQLAERVVAAGAEVDVVTSCARSYVDWADHYPPGTTRSNGVTVHRLPVVRPRDDDLFGPLNPRLMTGHRPVSPHLQHEWMRFQGPDLLGFEEWLTAAADERRYDAVAVFTYLYKTSADAIATLAGRLPIILHTLAHDEPPLYLPLFDVPMRVPDGLAFLAEEEAALFASRFGSRQPAVITGMGFDPPPPADAGRFRQEFGIDDPYLLVLGRLDPHKGSVELASLFAAYKRLRPGPLKLAVVGEPVRPLKPHPDIVVTGFVDEQTKHDALAGCEVFIHPSYFESFSIVLLEAWQHRKAALVQAGSAVLQGQCRRSQGGLWYRGYGQFEGALDLLLADPALRARLGAAGARYVERRYQWPTVVRRYLRFVARFVRPHVSLRAG